MRVIFRIIFIVFAFTILTIVTQVGGVIFLLSMIAWRFTNRFMLRLSVFVALYLIATFIVVPIIAKQYGRVRLPIVETNGVKPRTIWTCILNRNYVKPALYNACSDVASKIRQQFPGTVINYLDSSFPFFDNMPLLPHLSHGDGRKLDIAFQYIDQESGNPSKTTPSPVGYGVYEAPVENEVNQHELCRQQGFWQYDILPGKENDHEEFLLDEARTRSLVDYFAEAPSIEKIFIEPHLKKRLQLTNSKVRFQGCRAARHDDHIHIQVK